MLKSPFTLAATACLLAPMFALANIISPLPANRADLDSLRWQKRPVLVFAPSTEDAHYRQQMALFEKAKNGLLARDIVVLTDTHPAASGKLRSKIDPKGFEVILVGKDGGIKLRQTRPLTPDALFATIDRMPMRRAEMSR
ncbi:DUF4174 domain-containing protein [Gallaecimonas mangrovi]|uniref:DUF4174 domain-containing protein n=1 Tax=Gallaecimonas mangrovi TaxID=2291597 RepID=UPI000E1FEAF0|nr:DUF4174 domain-containing protein [Gallaecimonas mangrovi]